MPLRRLRCDLCSRTVGGPLAKHGHLRVDLLDLCRRRGFVEQEDACAAGGRGLGGPGESGALQLPVLASL
eukprot:8081166-Alexandrium_andersonii.AAC.1